MDRQFAATPEIARGLDSVADSAIIGAFILTLWFVAVFAICAGITAWLANWVKREADDRRIQEQLLIAELSDPE